MSAEPARRCPRRAPGRWRPGRAAPLCRRRARPCPGRRRRPGRPCREHAAPRPGARPPRLPLAPGQRASFATYFNAFPAGYWRRWTVVDSVTLRVWTRGEGTLIVYRSTARGATARVGSYPLSGDTERAVDLPLKGFGDGGWYWFDLVAGQDELRLVEADWRSRSKVPRGSATIGITTFNRPTYCTALLEQLASDEIDGYVDEVLVIDQGTSAVRDDAAYPAAAARLGSMLRLVEQRNLGGSGGFSRDARDARRRPELLRPAARRRRRLRAGGDRAGGCLRRPRQAADHRRWPHVQHVPALGPARLRRGRHPVAVPLGRSRSHTTRPRPRHLQPPVHPVAPPAHGRGLQRLVDVPDPGRRPSRHRPVAPVVHQVGRRRVRTARRGRGVPDGTLPGAAVWHVPWTDKDDSVDWQAYFHARNRFVAALLHSPFAFGGRMVRESLAIQVKHLLGMQYSAAALRQQALRDVLAGPERLHQELPHKLAEVRLRGLPTRTPRCGPTPRSSPLFAGAPPQARPAHGAPCRPAGHRHRCRGRLGAPGAAGAGLVRRAP